MASGSTLLLPSSATALKLLTAVYKPPFKIQDTKDSIAKLVFENGQEILGETTISEYLGTTQSKVDLTPELRAEVHEWLSRSLDFGTDPHEVYAFDSWMASRFLALRTPTPTWLDFFLFARIHPIVKSWSKEETWQFPAIFRFVDYIQHQDVIVNLSSHERGQLQPIALSDVSEIPKEYKLPRDQRPINCLPVVARSTTAVDSVTKSLAATSLNSTAAPTPAEPTPAAAKKDKKAAKKAEKKTEPKPKQEKKPDDLPNPGMIDLRVGIIRKAEKHPDADSLYVSHIDVGEEKERIVCSGLVKYIPLEEMQGRHVVCVCNLKEVKMRGVTSQAMVLAASERVEGDAEKEKVELVIPPPEAKAGTKVYVSSFEVAQPEAVLPPKKKIFEAVQPGFTTLPDLTVAWKKPDSDAATEQSLLVRVDGVEIPCKVPSIVGATVR